MKYIYQFIIVIIFCLLYGYSDQTFDGIIVDYDDKAIDRARIEIVCEDERYNDTTLTMFTNEGKFRFDNLQSNLWYTVRVYNSFDILEIESEVLMDIDKYQKYQIDSFSNQWQEFVYSKRMDFFLGRDSLYKYLDKSTLSIIEPELKSIYNSAHKKIIEYFQTKFSTTKSVQVGTYFDENKYLTHLLSLSNPSQAEADRLKMVYTYPRYDDIKQSNNREIKINRVSYKKTPKWSDVVKYAGGYSKLAEKGISKEKIGNFTLTEKLDFIEIINNEICKAHFRMYGEKEAFDFYNQIEKSRTLMGDIIIPKIDYSNLDKVEIRYDLGKGELNGRLTIMSKRDQKEMKSTIKTMFDDLVSKDEFDNTLYENPKTRKLSKKLIEEEKLKREEEKLKREEGKLKREEDQQDLLRQTAPLDKKLTNLDFPNHFIKEVSIEKKRTVINSIEKKDENYHKHAKLKIYNQGYIWVEDLVIHEDGITFKNILIAKPKINFGIRCFYPFQAKEDYGDVMTIEIPKKKTKKFRKSTKVKLIYSKD